MKKGGKVFISCGQRPPKERKIADAVKQLLEKEFELTPRSYRVSLSRAAPHSQCIANGWSNLSRRKKE